MYLPMLFHTGQAGIAFEIWLILALLGTISAFPVYIAREN